MAGVYINKDNRGISLVELIVALSMGIVIAGAVAALIAFSLRQYSNQSKISAIQSDIQVTLNPVVDSIESAQWFDLNQEVDASGNVIRTNYAAFGRVYNNKFTGEIYVTGYNDGNVSGTCNLYVNRYKDESVTDVNALQSMISSFAWDVQQKSSIGTDAEKAALRKYLLGENLATFCISGSETNKFETRNETDEHGNIVTNGYYKNPIAFDIQIEYKRSGFGSEISRKSKDEAYLRNTIESEVFIEERSTNINGNKEDGLVKQSYKRDAD